MTNRDWLESVKKGDTVVVVGPRGDSRSVGKVARLTSTRLFVRIGEGPETAFRISDGQEVGASIYYSRSIEHATPELLTTVRHANRKRFLARELNHRNWDNVSLEILEAITLLLSEAPKDV